MNNTAHRPPWHLGTRRGWRQAIRRELALIDRNRRPRRLAPGPQRPLTADRSLTDHDGTGLVTL